MLNFDRYTVKHGTQNTENDCHQWLSDSFRVHRIRFRPGLRSASEMTYIVSSGALNSTHSLPGLRSGPQ